MNRLIILLALSFNHTASLADEWKLHTIDDGSRGADGVRLGDFDQDGQLDIVTGWEEGGQIRICFQPNGTENQTQRIRSQWPTVTIGKVSSPEDAMAVDVNGDGWLDVVSCCEGKTKNVFVHLNPGSAKSVASASAWRTKPLLGAAGVTRWMYCCSVDENLLVFGSKEPAGQITLCDLSQQKPRWQKLRNCDWVMSLEAVDFDQDGDRDILYSDRKGANRQVGWLQNPGNTDGPWIDRLIGGDDREVMFLDILKQTNSSNTKAGLFTVACQTKDGGLLLLEASTDGKRPWQQTELPKPMGTGSGKGVSWGDIDLDGQPDLVCSCEHAGDKVGVYWMQRKDSGWQFRDISGNQSGTKFDQIALLDLDGDGDLDVITCEERNNLGVIWYENPER
ncbi:MAG: VCBS repeat-containing protein [Fuerstiella sp.]